MFRCVRIEHHHSKGQRVVHQGKASIPEKVHEVIDFIGGISELWTGIGKQMKKNRVPEKRQNVGDNVDLKITPARLRQYYNISQTDANQATNNYMAVAAFNDYYSSGAFQQFYANIENTPAPSITDMGSKCLDAAKPCDQFESDLDVQYMTALGKGVNTLFHNINNEDGWVLQFSENAQVLNPMPKLFSISYGWAELKQCQIAFEICDNLGYSSRQYVTRTNMNFQKLAVMGVSLFVSDGDDGAQSVQPDGENPIDMDHWCPGEYVCYPKTSSQCGEVVLRNTTTGARCVYPSRSHGGRTLMVIFGRL